MRLCECVSIQAARTFPGEHDHSFPQRPLKKKEKHISSRQTETA